MNHDLTTDESTLPAALPPWLARLPWVAALPALTQRQWRTLGLVALAALVGSYDLALLQLALPQIEQSLAIPATQLSDLGAIIKLGSLPAFGFALAADGWGRRRLLIGAVLCFTLLTGATALAPNAALFVTLQFLVRMFVTVVAILAGVFIVEEFPAQVRGWGMGAYSAIASVGGGMAALLFALVEVLPFGWRALYLLGLGALGLLPLWRAALPETTRFLAQQATQATTQPTTATGPLLLRLQPLRQLIHTYPRRLLALGSIILFFNLGGDAALFYDPTYLQQAHGWQPWQISLLNLSAGFMAVLGSVTAGRMSDGVGRKRATALFLVAMPLFIIGYYNGVGWLLPLLWAGLLFSSIGATVVLGAMNGELFPTSYRATAAGATALWATLSGALSLLIHGRLVSLGYSPWFAISLLALLLLVTPLFILLLPETSGRTLEEIAPERV
ncbi:MAG: MFS transporter [Caldilineaceae bacterium]